METDVKISPMAAVLYSVGRAPKGTVQRRGPGSLQEVVPTSRENGKRKKPPDKPYDPENKFQWQGPRPEVPVMYWKPGARNKHENWELSHRVASYLYMPSGDYLPQVEPR